MAVVGDYGVSIDEEVGWRNTQVTIDYALGVSEDPPHGVDRYFGVAFRLPALLAECALGLQDSRDIYLTRHLLTHWFFIAGGFACGMLAYRTLGSRWVALFAMLMFLLHPRLYAHSFFNIKDIPFTAALIIALYLARRAFRKDTLGAFLLCGIGVGLAINLRVFGLMLLPMILAMRALDLWQAGRESAGVSWRPPGYSRRRRWRSRTSSTRITGRILCGSLRASGRCRSTLTRILFYLWEK